MASRPQLPSAAERAARTLLLRFEGASCQSAPSLKDRSGPLPRHGANADVAIKVLVPRDGV
eukprot:12766318-Alexandrium_andersonii.AAC.1